MTVLVSSSYVSQGGRSLLRSITEDPDADFQISRVGSGYCVSFYSKSLEEVEETDELLGLLVPFGVNLLFPLEDI